MNQKETSTPTDLGSPPEPNAVISSYIADRTREAITTNDRNLRPALRSDVAEQLVNHINQLVDTEPDAPKLYTINRRLRNIILGLPAHEYGAGGATRTEARDTFCTNAGQAVSRELTGYDDEAWFSPEMIEIMSLHVEEDEAERQERRGGILGQVATRLKTVIR
jgi:hypothetical protein